MLEYVYVRTFSLLLCKRNVPDKNQSPTSTHLVGEIHPVGGSSIPVKNIAALGTAEHMIRLLLVEFYLEE